MILSSLCIRIPENTTVSFTVAIAFSLIHPPVFLPWNHKFIERLALEGPFNDHLVQTPYHGQGHLSLGQAQSLFQPDLEHCQWWDIHNFLVQPVPVSHWSRRGRITSLDLLDMFFWWGPGYSWLSGLKAHISSSCPIFHSPIFTVLLCIAVLSTFITHIILLHSGRYLYKRGHFSQTAKSCRSKERSLNQLVTSKYMWGRSSPLTNGLQVWGAKCNIWRRREVQGNTVFRHLRNNSSRKCSNKWKTHILFRIFLCVWEDDVGSEGYIHLLLEG